MLDDKSRVTLFWFTIGMIVVVVVIAIVTLIRACEGPIAEEAPLAIRPTEAQLCLGQSLQFTIEDDVVEDTEITWRASGGSVSTSGLFTADTPGDYTVTAIRDKPRSVVQADIHVAPCTPTPTPTLMPTATPTPIPTASPTPTPTPADPQGDVATYENGTPIEGSFAGLDIRAASIDNDLRVNLQPGAEVPAELADWVVEGETVLWIEFHQPIPDPPAYTDWLFALDLDNDPATGRPAGSARVNPDLGDDAIVGVLYNPAVGDYAPYFLVWNPTQGEWVDGPDVVRYTIDPSRTLIGLALPLQTLTQSVAQTTGVSFAPEAARSRAAALSFADEQSVIDFYPERP